MTDYARPRLIGFNHVALEVGDIEEALAFYGRLFTFELRGKSGTMAFIDLGDQFIALQKGRTQPADDGRHIGLVVDDKQAARKALEAAGVPLIEFAFRMLTTRRRDSRSLSFDRRHRLAPIAGYLRALISGFGVGSATLTSVFRS